ncbi:MAG: hypothetical protein FD149_735, partial [Rhodospirillaceae bacterium]
TDLPLHAQPPSTSPQKRESRIAARRQFPEVSSFLDHKTLMARKFVEVFLNGNASGYRLAGGGVWIIDGPTPQPLHPAPAPASPKDWSPRL